jgi:hypothetical protein
MNKSKKIDFIVLIILALIVIPIVVFGQVKFLISTFLFLGLPSIYLIMRKTQNLKVIFSGVFLIGVILGFVFDFLATLNNAWIIPDEQLLIPYRVLGFAPVDELICLVLWVLLMLLVYEHFFERKRVEKLHIKHFLRAGVLPAFLSLIFVIIIFFLDPNLVSFPYAYLILGLMAAAPMIYFVFHKPKILHRVLKAAPYFIFLYLIFEITALYLNQWGFPGQYIGYIEFFSFKFPLEELTFWIVISSTIVLADYKLFVDDE